MASGSERPGLVALGLFGMLAMPTFDLFPFGYHRFTGMCVLLWATSPRAKAAWLARIRPQEQPP